eukprot:scaffold76607_cov20-Tisochrysis_lutea.AAC.7
MPVNKPDQPRVEWRQWQHCGVSMLRFENVARSRSILKQAEGASTQRSGVSILQGKKWSLRVVKVQAPGKAARQPGSAQMGQVLSAVG